MFDLSGDLLLMQQSDDGVIQVISSDEGSDIDREELPDELLILPIKNTVLFPGVVIPITVTRQRSIRLIEKAHQDKKVVGVIAQRHTDSEAPSSHDLYRYGTVAKIVKVLVLPDGNTTVIIQGKSRFMVKEFLGEEPYIMAKALLCPDHKVDERDKKIKELLQQLRETASKMFSLNLEFPQEAQRALDSIHEVSFLIHFLSSNLGVKVRDKQKILEVKKITDRGALLFKYMLKEIQRMEISNEIRQKVNTDMDKQQRDYLLRQQIKALQDELGAEGPSQDIEKLRQRGSEKKWPKAVAGCFAKELDKLQRISSQAAEYPLVMNYIEFMLELPWAKCTTDFFDLEEAKRILDRDHFGLTKVKNRILEYLAVLKLKRNMKGPILCLCGPPGVGKTSLGRSIAKSLKRCYVRMSLGGVHDEAEIRGHRKTYVGAMPGKILQYIKKAKSSNPVFVLDEIDKVRSSFNGDPASALLEVLDPEQNNAFADNYLEITYDLSHVLFIATANSLDTIQDPLKDRMEVIEISGYTVEEKEQIAKLHLIPKQIKEHGLKNYNIKFKKEATLQIITNYTRESGVRNLERKIGTIMRHVAKSVVMAEKIPHTITAEYVIKALGMPLFDEETYQGNSVAGVVTGLAWTRVGGDILFVESSVSKGKGALTLSGQLGDVMKESAAAALSFLKAKASLLKIDYRVFRQYDLHIHVPAGAIPKDGPSAGITMLTALASVFTQRKVRARLAMTGEITLRGKVLSVGGIKEKILAAKRYGIKEIVLSKRNKRDIEEIENIYTRGLKFYFVDNVDEVLDIALLKEKVKQPLCFDLHIPFPQG